MDAKQSLKKLYLATRTLLLWPIGHLAGGFRPPPDPVAIKEILFLRHDRIGDLALSLPTLRRLKQAFPGARLTVVASPANQDLLRHNADVDEVFVYRGLGSYLRFVARHHFDLAIDPFHNSHQLLPAFMTLLAGARHRIGFALAGREVFFTRPAPSYDETKSFHQLMQLLLASLGISEATAKETEKAATIPLLPLSPTEQREAAAMTDPLLGKQLIAIHPGAFYPSQKWPLDRFTEVAQELSSQGFGVLFFAPTKEFPDFAPARLKDDSGILLIREASLRQCIAILSRCELLICNNSGPLHLAWALGIRTVSLMGPTVPAVWWPQGQKHKVLRRDLPCSPCNLAICPTHDCLQNITVAEVLSAVTNTVSEENE
ncbi:MAG: hypothetical protein A2505_05715 [Deltaproteobacteria bacterium RIFOXYD12_FULL_55_16]|nr:MAG: hypothetical protein A2505_05715 [Deltaproteobacteria bacterium RIFOXYD12_FULL_55_16]